MSDTELAFHVSVKDAPDDGACVVVFHDHFLNYAHSDELKANVKELCRARIGRGTRRFVFDLSPVTVMDSCGLSILISAKKTVEGLGGRFALASLTPMIARLFEVTKLDRSFEIHATAPGAIAAMQHAA